MTSKVICPECGGDSWVICEEVCTGQDDVLVDVKCNTTGCNNKKVFKVDISEGVEMVETGFPGEWKEVEHENP